MQKNYRDWVLRIKASPATVPLNFKTLPQKQSICPCSHNGLKGFIVDMLLLTKRRTPLLNWVLCIDEDRHARATLVCTRLGTRTTTRISNVKDMQDKSTSHKTNMTSKRLHFKTAHKRKNFWTHHLVKGLQQSAPVLFYCWTQCPTGSGIQKSTQNRKNFFIPASIKTPAHCRMITSRPKIWPPNSLAQCFQIPDFG